ncbi:hypothetical protein ACQP2T_61385 [Nonomuraea sp. CA-143628]|uniref:hypothetical protein n=1 Tax=Nonomuraea sp. CA-143628 TaxID=3239997 RepID=UPI003D923759
MEGAEQRPLPVENLVYEVHVAGELVWCGYTLTCPECSSQAGWSLHVQQPLWTRGEMAWALCPLEHRLNHPLIYPEVVHLLLDWSCDDPLTRPLLEDALSSLPWVPHVTHWRIADYSEELHSVMHIAWDKVGGGHRNFWDMKYPELVEASQPARASSEEDQP